MAGVPLPPILPRIDIDDSARPDPDRDWRTEGRQAGEAICPEVADGFLAAYETAVEIPGWLAPVEAARLYRLGCQATSNVLEVGTYHGKSTYLIACGMRDAASEAKLVTVDAHRRGVDQATGRAQILAPDSQLAVGRMLKARQLEDRVIQMVGWSDQSVFFLDLGRFGAAFIDGGRDFESCSKDFLTLRGRLSPDQELDLLFHGYGPAIPGVQQTVDYIVKQDRRFRFREVVHSLFVCRLVASARGA